MHAAPPRPPRLPRLRGRDAATNARPGPAIDREQGVAPCGTTSRADDVTRSRRVRPSARPHPRPPPTATRGGTALRSPRPTAPRTVRSPIAKSSSMSSSKKRTGDTTFLREHPRRQVSVGPSTHPRIDRPWNGTCTREPTPAPSSGGEVVRERPVEGRGSGGRCRPRPGRRGRAGHRGANRRRAEVVGAVGRLPGELLAPEVPVRGGLAVDRAGEVEVADDRRRPEVEHLADGLRDERPGSTCSVPNVSSIMDTGCAVPIAYAT